MPEAKTVLWGTGRRKTAVARVRVAAGEGRITVNRREVDAYFPTADSRLAVRQPLLAVEGADKWDVVVSVRGGGLQGQADAVRHGIARALAKADETLSPKLREAGFLTRDSRRKERKKYGQRAARARFQFSKR
jgi:small subunit ribosomal protein S9